LRQRERVVIFEPETVAMVAMSQLHVRKVSEEVVARLKQQAARSGRSMEAEHRLILEEALFPERRPGRRLLEVLQAGPFAEPDFAPERARDHGRRIEL
jgi:plasmid stability protein